MLGISSDWSAFCLDSAVATFGTAVQNELDGVEGKNKREIERKRETILRRFLPEVSKAKKFRDPGKR